MRQLEATRAYTVLRLPRPKVSRTGGPPLRLKTFHLDQFDRFSIDYLLRYLPQAAETRAFAHSVGLYGARSDIPVRFGGTETRRNSTHPPGF